MTASIFVAHYLSVEYNSAFCEKAAMSLMADVLLGPVFLKIFSR